MKLCKSCKTEQPEENFSVAATVNGKTYRRLNAAPASKHGKTSADKKQPLGLLNVKKPCMV